MTNFLKQLQDIAISRVKNTLFLTFILSWMTVNYDFVLTVLFSDIKIEEKINYIKNFSYSLDKSLWYPLAITLFYQFLLPLFNLALEWGKNKTVTKWITNHKNETLKSYYEDREKVEKAKVKLENIAREYELKFKKEESKIEKENLDLKEFKEYQEYKITVKYPPNDEALESINQDVENPDDMLLLSLNYESKILLKEASLDSDGIIFYHHFIGGSKMQTNRKDFITSDDSRETAKWEAAIEELQNYNLIVDTSGKGEVFKLTSYGYQLADNIKKDNKTLEDE